MKTQIDVHFENLMLTEWVNRLLTAGNHLAVALGTELPDGWERWTREEAMDRFAGNWKYEVWVAWRAAMDISQAKRKEFGDS